MATYPPKENLPSSSFPEEEEINTLKIEAIEVIMQIDSEDILSQLATYFDSLIALEDADSKDMPMVCEPESNYTASSPIEIIKLNMIRQIVATPKEYLLKFACYLHQIYPGFDISSEAMDESLKDIETGRVYQAQSVEEMFKQILEE